MSARIGEIREATQGDAGSVACPWSAWRRAQAVGCGLTLGSDSKHCQARARTSISRGEKETDSSLAMGMGNDCKSKKLRIWKEEAAVVLNQEECEGRVAKEN